MQELPQEFKAIRVHEFNKPPTLDQVKIPVLKNGQFLVRVEAAPVNPSDLLYMQGRYKGTHLPATAGFEGAGVVVQLGPEIPDWLKLGSRVGFFAESGLGTYAEYSVGHINKVLLLDEDTSFELGATFYVNPMTVIAMIDQVKQLGINAIVHNAAASALGRQLIRYAKLHNIWVINIVRRQEQVKILLHEDADYILNENDPDFPRQFQDLTQQLNATIIFEPVGGDQTAKLLNLMPFGSTAYVYGSLSGSPTVNLNVMELMAQKKTVSGFMLGHWFAKNPKVFHDLDFHKKLNELLKNQLKTTFVKHFSLEQFEEGIEYYKAHQTQGKIIIKPQ